MNVGKLNEALEAYLQKNLLFTNLQSVALTVVEGNTAASQSFTSTAVRFSGMASFSGEVPPLSDVTSQQGYALKALPDIQVKINENSALQGVTVAEVSFDKISPDEVGSSSSSGLGVLLGAVLGVSALVFAGGFFIVRRHRAAQRQHVAKPVSSPLTITSKEPVLATHGCGSLVSGQISLGDGDGDGDLSAYMLSPTKKIETAKLSHPAEISIQQVDDDEYDDNYLTTDEASITL